MKLVIERAVLDDFPEVVLGVAVARGVDNRADAADAAALERRLLEAQQRATSSFAGVELVEHPHVACWREAYRRFGAKPKKYPSSIENLLRRALEGEAPRHINRLVDLYNAISLEHLMPVGGEDADTLAGDLRLVKAGDDEAAVRLLGEAEERAPKPGEIFYRDDAGAVCRRWNWKEADRTKLTESTMNAVLVIEALPPVGREKLEAAVQALASLVQERAGGEVATGVLDRDQPEIPLL